MSTTAVVPERSPLAISSEWSDPLVTSIAAHPWFADIVGETDKWVEMRRAAGRLGAYRLADAPAAEESEFAVRIVDGADPEDAAREYHHALAARANARTVNQLVDRAQVELRSRAETWVFSQTETVSVSARMNQQLDEARKLLRGPLVGIRTGEDLAEHPEKAVDFAAFSALARDFYAGTTFARLLAGPAIVPTSTEEGEGYLYDLRLFAKYEEVWPDFYAAPHVQPPWTVAERSGAFNRDEPTTRLRYFAGIKATVDVAGSSYELRRRIKAMTARSREVADAARRGFEDRSA